MYSATSLSHTHTHTHPFNGPLSGTTRVSQYQKGKTNVDFTEARDCEWQWHQLGHMQVCTTLQTDNHGSTPPLFSTGRMPFLPPNQQRQSTEGHLLVLYLCNIMQQNKGNNHRHLKYINFHVRSECRIKWQPSRVYCLLKQTNRLTGCKQCLVAHRMGSRGTKLN